MDQAEVQRLLMAAMQAQSAGVADEATRLYYHILADGENAVALNALGVQALSRGRQAEAVTLFGRAITVDPHAPDLWMNLAKAYRGLGDDAGEMQALEGALAIDRVHFMALVRQAELFDRTGRPARGAAQWAGVVAMAAGVEQRGPGFAALLDHARAQVAAHRTDFAATIDEGLAGVRTDLPADARRRFDACIDHALGRRTIHANQCAGLHFPFLPAEEFFPRAHFPWLADLEAQTPVIRAELEALLATDASAILPYVAMEPGTPANKWTPLDRSAAWGALHLWKDGRRIDAACTLAPRTAAIVERLPLSDLPGRTPTVFFSLLRPGTLLPPHTGVSNVRTIIHLPLIVPPGCGFRVGGDTREWVAGEAWAFDDTIEHEAWNRSELLRAILIFDVWNPHLTSAERDLLRRFYAVADTGGGDAVPGVAD